MRQKGIPKGNSNMVHGHETYVTDRHKIKVITFTDTINRFHNEKGSNAKKKILNSTHQLENYQVTCEGQYHSNFK